MLALIFNPLKVKGKAQGKDKQQAAGVDYCRFVYNGSHKENLLLLKMGKHKARTSQQGWSRVDYCRELQGVGV